MQPSMSDWKSGKFESPLELKLVQKKTLELWLNAKLKQEGGGAKAAAVKPEKKAAKAAAAPTAMPKHSNIVRCLVKPGYEKAFEELCATGSSFGQEKFFLVKTGEREYVSVGLWDSEKTMVDARPEMIKFLDKMREMLEETATGVTDPRSGTVVSEGP